MQVKLFSSLGFAQQGRDLSYGHNQGILSVYRGTHSSSSQKTMTLKSRFLENIGKHGQAMDGQGDEPGASLDDNMTVLLTGSTGNLGAYLLDTLLANAKVERVTCLNRSEHAQERQTKNHQSRGLSTDFDSDRLEFLQSNDLSAVHLGLSEATYAHLASRVTHILHCAWPVNFNRHFTSFEPQIRGVRTLIEFARHSHHDAVLFFVSSISVATNWGALPGARATVPEIVLKDWRLAEMGYGQSKLVCERILDEASKRGGVNTAICRVGQIAGPILRGKQGEWVKQEWVPSMIASCKLLGKLPKTLGLVDNIDWIPVDVLATIIMELLPIKSNPSRATNATVGNHAVVHHVANPKIITWNSIMPTVYQYFRGELSIVDFPEWCEALQRSFGADAEHQTGEANPAIKLWDYFDNLRDKTVRFPKVRAATLDTSQTVRRSATMAGLDAVSPEWMALWLSQWAF